MTDLLNDWKGITKMSEMTLPLTLTDIRDLADKVEKILDVVGENLREDDEDWRWGLEITLRDDMNFLQGVVKPHPDGWMAFFPAQANT